MRFLDLFTVAVMPVLKVILITGVGLLLAMDRINLLGPEARHHLNNIVFYVLGPSLVASNLAETITFQSFVTLWFMPVNIFITFIIGSVLAWILIRITKTPKHLQGMVIGCCSAGNMGNLLLIVIPAVCKESNNPFGDSSLCSTHAEAYASLSMAIGAIFIWSYVYTIMRMYAQSGAENVSTISLNSPRDTSKTVSESCTEALLPSSNVCLSSEGYSEQDELPITIYRGGTKMPVLKKTIQHIKMIMGKIDLKKVFAPTAIAAIVGFIIGIVSPIRKLIIGDSAPLHGGSYPMFDIDTRGQPSERFKWIRSKPICHYRDYSSEKHTLASLGDICCKSCTSFWNGWPRFLVSVCSYASACCSTCNCCRYNNTVFSAWSG
ncbi:protein PIN-LIKES 3-like isoform X3 [Durio zibethinus]|uniref:Protein PIN-LIKES 3-like isoform X3 n=1 Tax=Durio zibethinus TaxID=66656 RepID=A0A6P6AII9_DURZI|nr:protein PIN-LIKES 3-like isoform X3 [Durio zibethinus]